MNGTHDMFDTTLDVLIVGAGLSGIGMACYLQREMPDKKWAIAEAREQIGGTWDLFKYPGIRSDSDLFTFSYEFKPWASENAIASAKEILDYVHEVVEEYEVADKIKYGTEVISANWDSAKGLWVVTLKSKTTGTTSQVMCRWLFSATGYYNYDQGFRPEFSNEDSFKGEIHHAQFWPEDLDLKDKRVAIVGSGATAITLVPELVKEASHVIQVQRTPSYVMPLPRKDGFAKFLGRFLSDKARHKILRWRNARIQVASFHLYQKFPKFARWQIKHEAMKFLPKDYPYDIHFNPPYEPWDQRLCVTPDGDFFKALGDGQVSIVTDEIDQFCETGLQLKSGDHVDADIIVLATGLNVKFLGGMKLTIDGNPVHLDQKLMFKGMMLEDVPNFSVAIGYTNASWMLKIGLLCQYLCKLLAEMDRQQKSVCVVTNPDNDMKKRPMMDFGAGYVQRSLDKFPQQGEARPWLVSFNYLTDVKELKNAPTIHSAMTLSSTQKVETHN